VSTKFEIASLTAQVDGANAILFDNIKESKLRLVANLVGNRQRFAKAISGTEETIHDKVISAIERAKKPRVISDGKFFENRSKDLSILPIVTHFEKESGPFITSSIIHVQNPEKKTQNSSFHRLMPIDKTHFSVRMVEGRHLHRSFMDAKERNHGRGSSCHIDCRRIPGRMGPRRAGDCKCDSWRQANPD
jgi:UbiD family decarboxylase